MFTTLRGKIIAGYALIIALNLVVVLWSINSFSRTSLEAQRTSTRYVMRASALSSISIRLARSPRQDADDIRFIRRQLDVVESTIDTGFSDFRELSRTFEESVSGITGAESAVSSDSSRSLLLAALEAYRDRSAEALDGSNLRLDEERNGLLYTIAVASILAALVSLVAAFGYSRWTLHSIDRLRNAVRSVGRGELTQKIHITSADELGDLSFEFNRMIEQLNEYERMNLERLLLEQRRAETILQSTPVPIIVVDDRGAFVSRNDAAVRVLGTSEDLFGVGEEIGRLVRRSVAGGYEESQESTVRIEREGIPHDYQIRILPLDVEESEYVVVLADVTRFTELDTLKSDLLARVSHELRTPLSSVVMGVDLIEAGHFGSIDKRGLDQIERMKSDLDRLRSMIESIMTAARVEGDRANPDVSLDDPVLFFEEIISSYRTMAAASKATIEFDGDPESIIAADISRLDLRTIIDNLVSNALAHIDQGGEVLLRCERIGNEVLLEVRDDGEGIPVDLQGRIFDKFFQVDRQGSNRPGSIGLGLSIVRDLLKSRGGSVSVESRPGKGARFRVKIPVRTDRANQLTESTTA